MLAVATQVDETLAESLPWNSFFKYLQSSWKERHRHSGLTSDFDSFWREALQHGGAWQDKEQTPIELSSAVFETSFSEPSFDGSDGEALTFIAYPSSRYYD